MDVTQFHNTHFSELRALMNRPQLDAAAREELWTRMKYASTTFPERYLTQWLPYMRGFSHHFASTLAIITSLGDLQAHGAIAPCACLGFIPEHYLSDRAMPHLLKGPWIENLTLINLCIDDLTPYSARLLAQTPALKSLTHLILNSNDLTDEGVIVLAQSSNMSRLTHLNLSDNKISDDGAHALACSPAMASLTHLNLSHNPITDHGIDALAQSPHLSSLTHLNLKKTQLTSRGALALASSPYLHKDIKQHHRAAIIGA